MQKNNSICIIQMHTNTIPSKLVRFFTRYKYSHVAISLSRNCDILYSFEEKKLIQFLMVVLLYKKNKMIFLKNLIKQYVQYMRLMLIQNNCIQ